ncbi:MAG TPA: hypothetical protein VI278_10440 [Nitrososphaeraceae archaeon]|jgi:hypothetical protein
MQIIQQDRQEIEDDAVPGTFSASFGVAAAAYVGESFDSSFLVVAYRINDNNHQHHHHDHH